MFYIEKLACEDRGDMLSKNFDTAVMRELLVNRNEGVSESLFLT